MNTGNHHHGSAVNPQRLGGWARQAREHDHERARQHRAELALLTRERRLPSSMGWVNAACAGTPARGHGLNSRTAHSPQLSRSRYALAGPSRLRASPADGPCTRAGNGRQCQVNDLKAARHELQLMARERPNGR